MSVCYIYVVLSGKRSLPYAILLCFQTLLNAATNLQIFPARDRLFFSLWLVVCLVLIAAYQSHLVSYLTLKTSEDAFENVADFYQSDFKILVPREYHKAAKEYVRIKPKAAPLLGKLTVINDDLWSFMRPADKGSYLCNVEDLEVFLPSYRIIPNFVNL